MSYSRYEPMGPLAAPSAAPAPRRWAALLAGVALLAVALAASWLSQRIIDRFLSQQDADAVQIARKVFERTLDEQRTQVLSQVGVLAEDVRIRSTVMMANPDEATVRDVLKDLMATSGAGLMAVLDVNGKVRAVTGIEGLRDVDLGSSAVVKAAVQRPSAYIWTFPQQVLAVGVAPIRAHDQVYAFLVMGFEAAKTSLVAIRTSLGVSAAVLLGDKLVAAGTDDPAALEALKAAGAGDGDKDLIVQGGGRSFFARINRVNESVATAKVAWAVPQQHQAERIYPLKLAILDALPRGWVDSASDTGCLATRRKGNVTNIKRSTSGVSLGMYISGAATLMSLLATGPIARAQEGDASEVDELRKQVRALEAQVQALRGAINDSIDLNRQQIAGLNRALKGGSGNSAEAAPSASPARSDAANDNVRPPPSLPKAAPVKGAAAVAVRGGARKRGEDPAGIIRGRVEVPAGEPVAYVYVENIFEPAVRGHKEVITQKEKHFVPRWAVVQRGTTIEFPNADNIYHNVFSLSSGNSFDLGLYNSSSGAKSHVFNEPGAVDIYCNIHPQMAASALVVPNRHFAKVKPDGSYEIPGIPGGKRKVVAWAPGSQLTSQWIEVEAGGTAELNLKLESKSAGHKNKAGRAYGSYE